MTDALPAWTRLGPGSARNTVFFLHGLYGSGRNWRSVARRCLERLPSRAALLVDLRMHGASRNLPPPHTLRRCAGDLERLATAEGRPDVVVGHSFGGRVALEWASRTPGPLRQLWIVDASPTARQVEGPAARMLDALRVMPGPFRTRNEAVEGLVDRGFPEAVGRWMATNLEAREGGYRWRLDPGDMEALLEDLSRTDHWPVLEAPPEGLVLHFVLAGDSGIVREEEEERLERAAAAGFLRLHRLAGGHWLNVDNPGGLVKLFTEGWPA